MITGNFFTDECPICKVYKFRTSDHKKQHAHFILCSAVEDIYKRCVLAPNKGRVRDGKRTIIDAEIIRIDIELGKCSAGWINPYWIKEEDRKYLSGAQLYAEELNWEGKNNVRDSNFQTNANQLTEENKPKK